MAGFLKQLVFFAFRIFNKVTNVTRKRCNGMRLKQDNRQEWQQQQQHHQSTRVREIEWGSIIAYLTRSHEETESPAISDLQNENSSLRKTKRMPGKKKSNREEESAGDYRRGNLKQCYAQYFSIKLWKLWEMRGRLYVHSMQTTTGNGKCVRAYVWMYA